MVPPNVRHLVEHPSFMSLADLTQVVKGDLAITLINLATQVCEYCSSRPQVGPFAPWAVCWCERPMTFVRCAGY